MAQTPMSQDEQLATITPSKNLTEAEVADICEAFFAHWRGCIKAKFDAAKEEKFLVANQTTANE